MRQASDELSVTLQKMICQGAVEIFLTLRSQSCHGLANSAAL